MRITNDKIKRFMELKAELKALQSELNDIQEAIKENGPCETKDFVVGIKEVEVKAYTVKESVRKQIQIIEKAG